MAKENKLTYIDIDKQIVLSSNTVTTGSSSNISNLFNHNNYNLKLQTVSDANAYSLSDYDEMAGYYGNLGESPLISVSNASFMLDASWSDLSDGRFSVSIKINNVASDLSTSVYKQHYLQIVGHSVTLDEDRTIAIVPYRTYNTMVDPDVELESSSSSSSE